MIVILNKKFALDSYFYAIYLQLEEDLNVLGLVVLKKFRAKMDSSFYGGRRYYFNWGGGGVSTPLRTMFLVRSHHGRTHNSKCS